MEGLERVVGQHEARGERRNGDDHEADGVGGHERVGDGLDRVVGRLHSVDGGQAGAQGDDDRHDNAQDLAHAFQAAVRVLARGAEVAQVAGGVGDVLDERREHAARALRSAGEALTRGTAASTTS